MYALVQARFKFLINLSTWFMTSYSLSLALSSKLKNDINY